MAMLKRNIILAVASLVLLAGCGGGADTTDTLPGESEVATTLEDTASDGLAATGDAVEQVAETAMESVGDVGWTNLQDNWTDSIGSIKDQWADLTEEELLVVNGDREQLVSLVQQKYGLDRETAELEVNDWASAL